MTLMDRQGESQNSGGGPGGPGELARRYLGWMLFGVFGIGVAVGIALVAGQLASQPVGITGEPVSATSSLASPLDGPPGNTRRKAAKRNRSTARAEGEQTFPSPTEAASAGFESSSSTASGYGTGGSGAAESSGGSANSGSSSHSGASSDDNEASSDESDSEDDDSSGDYDDDYEDDD